MMRLTITVTLMTRLATNVIYIRLTTTIN
jgi:hypothetical protein